MPLRAKVLEFAAAVDRLGTMSAEKGEPFTPGEGWEPEHLLLAALVRCSITSLRYHAKRVGSTAVASGSAHGTITQRESDWRYAFVAIECAFDVELEPVPDDVPALLAKAERDCFVGASLTATPVYRWTVNGSAA